MILVDGSHTLHRSLHTELGNLAEGGTNTGGVHGVIQSLSHLAGKYKNKRGIIVAWDRGVPLHRRELFRDYKPKKNPVGEVPAYLQSTLEFDDPSEEDLEFLQKYRSNQQILHRAILPAAGCLSIHVDNCEADDIISYVCHKITDEDITIVSSDRDLYQLINENVVQYDPIKKEFIDVETLCITQDLYKENWRENFLLWKAMKGDPADGIPGIPQVGDKLASGIANQLARGISKDKLQRPPRTRQAGIDNLMNSWDIIDRNYLLMDLRYPIENNLPMVKEIQRGFAKATIFDIDEYLVKSKLTDLGMNKAKVWINDVISSNESGYTKDYLKRLTEDL